MNRAKVLVLIGVLIIFLAGAGSLFVFRNAVAGFFVGRADIAYQAGNFSSAEGYLRVARLFDARELRIPVYFCRIALRTKSATAAQICETALTAELKNARPDLYSDILFNTGSAYTNLGHSYLKTTGGDAQARQAYEKAEEYYKEYLADNASVERPLTMAYLGDLYFYFLNRPEDAKDILEKLVSLRTFGYLPFQSQAREYMLLGRAYEFLKQYDKAIDALNKAAALNAYPDKSVFAALIHLQRARALVQAGKIQEGLAELTAGQALGKGFIDDCSASAVYYLAARLDAAIAAASAKQSDPWCALVIGLSYFDKGKYVQAKAPLEQFRGWADNLSSRYKETTLDINADLPAKSIFFHRAYDKAAKELNEIGK